MIRFKISIFALSDTTIDRETIALCLSHSWADVTDHYINYDRKRVDEAVCKVIGYVNSFREDRIL